MSAHPQTLLTHHSSGTAPGAGVSVQTRAPIDSLPTVLVRQSDVLVKPMLSELAQEYTRRYHLKLDEVTQELFGYPETEFAYPHGALLVIVENGEAVAGGALRRYDSRTAELKRIWTHSAHRRRGLGRRVLHDLEQVAASLGYTEIYLTTGGHQPEAKALYLAAGYTPEFDQDVDPSSLELLPFRKELHP